MKRSSQKKSTSDHRSPPRSARTGKSRSPPRNEGSNLEVMRVFFDWYHNFNYGLIQQKTTSAKLKRSARVMAERTKETMRRVIANSKHSMDSNRSVEVQSRDQLS